MIAMFRRARRTTSQNSNRSTLLLSLVLALSLAGSAALATVSESSAAQEFAPLPDEVGAILSAQPAGPAIPNLDPLEQVELRSPTTELVPEAAITCNGAGGLWSAPGSWTGGVPTAADSVTITGGCTITIDTAAVALSAVVQSGGILEWDAAVARTLAVGQSVVIDAGGIFRTPASGTITAHVLSLGTSLTNNGTLDFSTNTNTAGAGITFTGAGNATFDGSGTTTNIRTLTINKGTALSNILELSTSNFSVQGTTTDGTPMAFLTLTNGTFKVSGSFTAAGRVFTAAAYTIPATAGFWLNNPNFTVSGQTGSPTNNGLLRLSNGVFNVGTASGNSMGGGTGSFFTIEGGTLNVTGRLNSASTNITYRQSGGVVNVSTVGNAASTTPSFGFTGGGTIMFFSGGSINLVQASTGATPVDYNQLGTMVFTGGTLNVGTAATVTNFIFRVQGQMPAVVIDNTTNNKTANLSGQGNVWGNLTLNTGTTLNLNPGTTQTLLMIGPAIVNNGAIVVNTNNTGSVNFAGGLQQAVPAYAQSYSGSGTYGTAALRIASVALQNPLGVTLNPAVPMLNTYRVNGFYGPLTGADRLALGNADAIAVVVQRGATGVPFAASSLDVAPNYSIGAGGLILVYAQSAAAVTTGPEVPGSRSVLSFQISNPTGVTVAGGSLTCTSATTCLVLGGGTLTTDSTNLFIVGNTAAASLSGGSALTYVNGPLARTLPASLAAAATYTFPVGKSSFKMFELVNPTTNAGGTVVVQTEVFDANSGGTAGTGFSALNSNRYWSAAITTGGANFTNATVRLTEQGTVASNAIGQSATQAGAYDSIAGAVAPPVIGPSSAVTALGFFAVGTLTGSGAMCGNFDIGAATVPPNFTTLTAAVAALNSQPMTCAVTFTLLDATYPTETYPIILQPNGGASATNTLTIKPGPGVNAAFTGSSATALIVLNGADWVTIDGSNTVGGTTRNVSLQNTNATLASAVIWGQSIGTGDSTTNNTVKNLVLTGNAPATTFAGVGFGSSVISTATAGLKNINNRIENNLIQSVQNGIVSFGASSIVKNTGTVITGNTIGGAGTLATGRTGIVVGFDDGTQVTNNSIVNVNGAVGSSDAIGIALGTLAMSNTAFTVTDVANVLVTGNFIGAVTKTDTFSAAGICLATTNYGTSRIANNSVFGVRANGTSGDFGVGIYIGNAGSAYSPTQVYYNSVSMDGNRDTGGASTQPSFALAILGANPMVDLRNNALYNISTAASAASGSYAIGISSTPPLTNFTSNFNDFFTSGTSSRFAMSGSLVSVLSDRPTLAAWQAATGTDANSIAVDPMFNSPTILAPQPGSPLIGAGTPVAVTVDILGVARSVSTPTIGAYEQAADLAGPAITYTAFANTTSTANRILAITATDFTGVPTVGIGLPVVYFRKGAGIYQASQCTFVSGSSYNCTLDYSLVGGVVTGDTIQYYVVAQDTLGNVSVNPAAGAAGFSANPPAAATPPTVPSSYLISPAIGGTRSVCASGCDFTTLTGAGGLFSALNTSVATSNLVVEIGSDLVVGEDGSVALNELAEEPAGSNFTLKIYPIGVARSITSTTLPAGGFIRLNGADRITIDGSIGGVGTDRSLTITDANTGVASAVIQLQSNGVNGAANNTLKNLIVIGNANTTTLSGITSGGSAPNSAGADNDNNRIENCDIRRAQFGIWLQGASTANKNTGTVVTRNVLTSTGADSIGKGALVIASDDGAQVTENTIGGIVSAASNDVFGMSFGGLVAFANNIASGGAEVSNATVTRNSIGVVQQTATFSAAGILIVPATTGTNLVANNFISGVIANGTSPDFGASIFVIDSGVDSTTRIYANSISMTGTVTGADQPQYAIAVAGVDPLLDLRDNIFLDTQATGAANNSYAIGLGYATFANLTSNFNDLFVPAAGNFRVGRTVVLGPTGGTDSATLANWQVATGKDPNSLSVDPLFVSLTDLHLQVTSPMISVGTPLAGITVDFDNDPRPLVTPDIGADEIVAGILAFSSSTYSDSESIGTTTITVTRTGGSTGSVSIDYATVAGGNAIGGAVCGGAVDFVNASGTLTFIDSDVSESFTVTICPDSVNELNETVNLALSNPLGGAIMGTPNTAVLTINDDDLAPTISITDVTQAELNAGTSLFTFGVSLSAASGQTVTVHYQTADGTATVANNDYVAIPDTILTFLPGETLKNVDVTVNGDTAPESTEDYFVNLSTATNASILDNQGLGTITNDDASSGPVTLTATAGTPGPTDYANLKAAFDAINAGTHQGVITIDVNGNTTETATAALNNSGAGSTLYTSVTITPSGGLRTISGTITGAIVKLNGADNVTIDGRIAGAGRNLAITNGSTTAASAAVWLASVAVGNGATNNVVRNLELACGPTNINASATFGIIMSGTTISATSNGTDNDNNQFIFNRIIRARYGIVTRGTTTNLNIAPIVTDNIVGPTSFGPDQIGKTGIFMQADTGAIVSRNTVQFVGGTVATATAGADRLGIALGSEAWGVTAATTLTSNTYTVTHNVIHDIVEELTFSAVGIESATTGGGSPTNNLIANNFIYNVRANGTLGDQPVGIGIVGGHTDQVVYNSIAFTGDQEPGAAAVPDNFGNAIRMSVLNGATHANLSLVGNSIYLDPSSTPAGVHYYAITAPSAAYSFGSGSENFNNLYINAGNAQLRTGGFATAAAAAATTEFATLANWQAAYTVTQDANSIQANPAYASPTSDLHLLGASPNINAGTAVAAVTVDIDNEARPNGAGYDIGADEFYATPGTLQLSSATYGGNEGTTLVVTVNRVSGNSGAVGVTYTLSNGSAVGGATCTAGVDFVTPGPQLLAFADSVTTQQFNVTLCADAPLADPGESFTITLSLPTGGATIGSPSVATASIVDIAAPFAGPFTVGSGGNYTSLTNPGGIFEAINLAGVGGNTTINITSDLAGETGAVALNEAAGGFSITIKPSGAPRIISGSSAVQLIKLFGADNVTIDGSLAAGTDRSLTLTNAGIGPLLWIGTNATSGATGNTLKNTNLIGPGAFSGQGIIAGSGATFGAAAEFPNSNNTIQNNSIKSVQNAAFISGNVASFDQNWTITGNDFGSTVVGEKLAFRGMLLGGAANFTISNNNIAGVNSGPTSTATMSGIQLSAALNGGSVTGNRISDIKHNNAATTTSGTNGIFLAATSTASNVLVANNFISDIASPGTTGVLFSSNGYGIAIATGGGYNIIHNSVLMNTNQGVNAATANSAAVVLAAGLPAASVNLRNNVLANTQALGTRFAVIDNSTAAVFSTINFNDYFAQNVGSLGGTQTTLANWQAATGQDANSLAVDPLFVTTPAPADLHLQVGSPVQNLGTPVATVTVDIDSNPRSTTTPEIGADELLDADLSITKTDGVGSVIPGGNTTYTIVASNAGPLGVTGATVADSVPVTLTCNWTCSGSGGGTCAAAGSGSINDNTVNLPAGASVTYLLACTVSPSASGSIVNTATVSSATADPNGANNSATDTNTVGSPSADLSITKTDGSATEIPGTSVVYTIVASNAGPSPAPSATVTDNFVGILPACSTTCVGAGGGTCTAGPVSGNINDTAVVLPVGGSVTYTATCLITSTATGSLVNTASVSSATADPNTSNNSATDTDTLNPSADVSITKTDGSATATAGQPVVYTIVASNAGPSAASTVTVADTFVASLTGCSTTVAYGGGATGAAGPFAGNLNTAANLPLGGLATYTATCTLSPSATGTLVNTATATVGGGATDPTPANNTATDTDTVLTLMIFIDGFESGNTGQWTLAFPLTFTEYAAIPVGPGVSELGFDYDFATVEAGRALVPNSIAVLTDASGAALVSIVARRTAASGQLELTLEVAGSASSSWVTVGEVAQQVRIEWSAASQSNLGHVAVYLDGRLALWIDGYAPTATPASVKLLRAAAVTSPVEP